MLKAIPYQDAHVTSWQTLSFRKLQTMKRFMHVTAWQAPQLTPRLAVYVSVNDVSNNNQHQQPCASHSVLTPTGSLWMD